MEMWFFDEVLHTFRFLVLLIQKRAEKCQYLKSATESHGDIQDFPFLLHDNEVYQFSAAWSCPLWRKSCFLTPGHYLIYRMSLKKCHNQVLWIFHFSMSLDEKYCTFSNSPFHGDYKNTLNSIPQWFLGKDIQQTLRSSKKNWLF